MTVKPAVDFKLLDVPTSSKTKDERDYSLYKDKSAPDSESADSAIQCRSKRKCFGTHSSSYTMNLLLHSRCPNRVLLLTERYCELHLHVVPGRISSHSSRHCWRSPLPHASALILRYFGCVLGVQQTKQVPHVAIVDLVCQLGV
ncbi:hypothetical protein TNCV_917491 [Trichonephila clavipes]|nr:hypothetical protein TNCV_917491 [Trichonephila clavipes]